MSTSLDETCLGVSPRGQLHLLRVLGQGGSRRASCMRSPSPGREVPWTTRFAMSDDCWLSEDMATCLDDEAADRQRIDEEWVFYTELFEMAARAATLHRLICIFGTVVQALDGMLVGGKPIARSPESRTPRHSMTPPRDEVGDFGQLAATASDLYRRTDDMPVFPPRGNSPDNSEEPDTLPPGCWRRSGSGQDAGAMDECSIPFDSIGEHLFGLVPLAKSVLEKTRADVNASRMYAAALENELRELRENANQALYETEEVVAGLRDKIDALALDADMAREDMRYWQEEAADGQRLAADRLRCAVTALDPRLYGNDGKKQDSNLVYVLHGLSGGDSSDASPLGISLAVTSLWEHTRRMDLTAEASQDRAALYHRWVMHVLSLTAASRREVMGLEEELHAVSRQVSERQQLLDIAHEEVACWQRRAQVGEQSAAYCQHILCPSREDSDDDDDDGGYARLTVSALDAVEGACRRNVELASLEASCDLVMTFGRGAIAALSLELADRRADVADLMDELELEHDERQQLDVKIRKHQALLQEKTVDIANIVGVARTEIDKKDTQLQHLKERHHLEKTQLEKDIAVLLEELEDKEKALQIAVMAAAPQTERRDNNTQTADGDVGTPTRSVSRGSASPRQYFAPLSSLLWPDLLVCCFEGSRVLQHRRLESAAHTPTQPLRGSFDSPPAKLTGSFNGSLTGSYGDGSSLLTSTMSMLVIDVFARLLVEVQTTSSLSGVSSPGSGSTYRRKVFYLDHLLSIDRSYQDRLVLRFRFQSSTLEFRFVSEYYRERCFEMASLSHPSLKCFSSALRVETDSDRQRRGDSGQHEEEDDDAYDFETIVDARAPTYIFRKTHDLHFGGNGECELVKSCLVRAHVAAPASSSSSASPAAAATPRYITAPKVHAASPLGSTEDTIEYDACCRLNVAASHSHHVSVTIVWDVSGGDGVLADPLSEPFGSKCHVVFFSVPMDQTNQLKDLLSKRGLTVLCSEVDETSKTFLGLASLPSVIPSVKGVNLVCRSAHAIVSMYICESSLALFVDPSPAAACTISSWAEFCSAVLPSCAEQVPAGADLLNSFHHSVVISKANANDFFTPATDLSCIDSSDLSDDSTRQIVRSRSVDRSSWRLTAREAGRFASFDLRVMRSHASLLDVPPPRHPTPTTDLRLRTLQLHVSCLRLQLYAAARRAGDGSVPEEHFAPTSGVLEVEFVSHMLVAHEPIAVLCQRPNESSSSRTRVLCKQKESTILRSATYCRTCLSQSLVHVVVCAGGELSGSSTSFVLSAHDLLCRTTVTRAGVPVGMLEFEWSIL